MKTSQLSDLDQEAIKLVEYHMRYAAAYRFLNASDEPRLFIAIQAHKKSTDWTYSFPLEAVKTYDAHKRYLNESLLQAIKPSDKADRPELIAIAKQCIQNKDR